MWSWTSRSNTFTKSISYFCRDQPAWPLHYLLLRIDKFIYYQLQCIVIVWIITLTKLFYLKMSLWPTIIVHYGTHFPQTYVITYNLLFIFKIVLLEIMSWILTLIVFSCYNNVFNVQSCLFACTLSPFDYSRPFSW